MKRLLILLPLLALAGCTSDQTRSDVATNSAAIYNAAGSLPPSPQVQAIQALSAANATAMGHPLTVTTTGAAITP